MATLLTARLWGPEPNHILISYLGYVGYKRTIATSVVNDGGYGPIVRLRQHSPRPRVCVSVSVCDVVWFLCLK